MLKMILLTGATGFLGKYLVDEFHAAGYKVRILARNPQNCGFSQNAQTDIVEGDILDIVALEKAMEGVEYVVHAAAMVSFNPQKKAEMKKINVQGTENVVNLCLEMGVKKLIYVSSIAALGRTEGNEHITEDTKWQNSPLNSQYAITKRQGELEIYRGLEEGLNAAIVNPGQIIGAGHWHQSTGQFFSIVNKGLSFYNRGINGAVGAADVAKAIRLLLESPYNKGERFLLVSESISQKDLFSQIALSIGKKPPKWELPPFIARIAGFVFEMYGKLVGKEPLITRETITTSLNQYFYDGSKVTRLLGMEYTPLSEVIKEAGKQFLKENP